MKQNCKIFKYKTSSHIRYFIRTKVNKSIVDKDINRSVHNRCRPVDISFISSLGFLQTTIQFIKDDRVFIGIEKSPGKIFSKHMPRKYISELRKFLMEYLLRKRVYFNTYVYSPLKYQRSGHSSSHYSQVKTQLS